MTTMTLRGCAPVQVTPSSLNDDDMYVYNPTTDEIVDHIGRNRYRFDAYARAAVPQGHLRMTGMQLRWALIKKATQV